MATVKVKRETEALRECLAGIISDGYRDGFQTYLDKKEARRALSLIRELPKKRWKVTTEECASSTIAHGVRYPRVKDVFSERGRLAFVLSRRMLMTLRDYARQDRHKKLDSATVMLFDMLINDVGMRAHRAALEVLAGTLIKILLLPRDKCIVCKCGKRHGHQCEDCGQRACPVHCKCSTGATRVRRRKKG